MAEILQKFALGPKYAHEGQTALFCPDQSMQSAGLVTFVNSEGVGSIGLEKRKLIRK